MSRLRHLGHGHRSPRTIVRILDHDRKDREEKAKKRRNVRDMVREDAA